jgi:hypothetical protein
MAHTNTRRVTHAPSTHGLCTQHRCIAQRGRVGKCRVRTSGVRTLCSASCGRSQCLCSHTYTHVYTSTYTERERETHTHTHTLSLSLSLSHTLSIFLCLSVYLTECAPDGRAGGRAAAAGRDEGQARYWVRAG